MSPGGVTYDRNTFKETRPSGWWEASDEQLILEGYVDHERLHLDRLRDYNLVEIDGVGGAFLVVRADLHRQGLLFPEKLYKKHIETEGLAKMAQDMGYKLWGMPNLEIIHEYPFYEEHKQNVRKNSVGEFKRSSDNATIVTIIYGSGSEEIIYQEGFPYLGQLNITVITDQGSGELNITIDSEDVEPGSWAGESQPGSPFFLSLDGDFADPVLMLIIGAEYSNYTVIITFEQMNFTSTTSSSTTGTFPVSSTTSSTTSSSTTSSSTTSSSTTSSSTTSSSTSSSTTSSSTSSSTTSSSTTSSSTSSSTTSSSTTSSSTTTGTTTTSGTSTTSGGTGFLLITLVGDVSSFNSTLFQQQIAAIAGIPPSEVVIQQVGSGSVQVWFTTPAASAQLLLDTWNTNQSAYTAQGLDVISLTTYNPSNTDSSSDSSLSGGAIAGIVILVIVVVTIIGVLIWREKNKHYSEVRESGPKFIFKEPVSEGGEMNEIESSN